MPFKGMTEANQCKARCKARNLARCNNFAVLKWGSSVCKSHGATDPAKRKRGKSHHNYTHGCRTNEVLASRLTFALLADALGVAQLFRTKPTGYKKLDLTNVNDALVLINHLEKNVKCML